MKSVTRRVVRGDGTEKVPHGLRPENRRVPGRRDRAGGSGWSHLLKRFCGAAGLGALVLLGGGLLAGFSLPAAAQTVFTDQMPTNDNFFDTSGPYELGMTLSRTSAGKITAIRHWKAPNDNATHVGRIWDSNGNQLAEVTFADNTGSGWKEQALTTPLPINANTTYVVSVNSGSAGDSGSYYAYEGPPTPLPVINGDLTGSQGVFIPSPGSFPKRHV